jgi:quinoprotein relay system zinc metallohydrolase 2
MLRLCLIFFISLITLKSQLSTANDFHYRLEEVSNNVFLHEGVHEDATPENIGAIANVGFIIGESCIAVIDSGGSFQEGQLLYQAIRQYSDKPICYVINTHVHPDHILGNAAFKQEHPAYVAHEKMTAALEAREDFFDRVFSEALGPAYEGAEYIRPTQVVSIGEPLDLDLGHRRLTLTAYSTSHTDHDLTVLDQATNTLWTGDLLFVDRIPVIDGSINGWIDTLNTLSQQVIDTVIPGHGPVQTSTITQAWQAERDYLETIRTGVRAIINDFGTIEDATKTVGLSESTDWALFEQYHRRNVTAAFVELEWE